MEMVAQWKSARTSFGRLGVQVSLISTPMGAVAQLEEWGSHKLRWRFKSSQPPPICGKKAIARYTPTGSSILPHFHILWGL